MMFGCVILAADLKPKRQNFRILWWPLTCNLKCTLSPIFQIMNDQNVSTQSDVTFSPLRSEKDNNVHKVHFKQTAHFHSFNLDNAPQSVNILLFVRS